MIRKEMEATGNKIILAGNLLLNKPLFGFYITLSGTF